jgi:protein phosphatase
MMPSYAAHGATDVGRKRVNNEDAFAIRPGDGLYVVADGMGGHSSGEVAAQLAVGTILGFFKDTTLGEESTWPYAYDENLSFAANKLVTAIATANDQIQAYASGHPESRGMGTTVVAVLIADDKATLSHVGDSRAYLFRDGKLQLLTMDHSWVGEQIRHGYLTEAEAVNHPFRNVITKALGTREQAQADVTELKLLPGDRLLLCSDGLNSMITDEIIGAAMARNEDLEATCQHLIEKANEGGGDDNITVVLIERTA